MNSWAEQQAIVQELIDTLDATPSEGDTGVSGVVQRQNEDTAARTAPSPSPGVSGLERARQLAAQAISLQPDPIPEQPELFE